LKLVIAAGSKARRLWFEIVGFGFHRDVILVARSDFFYEELSEPKMFVDVMLYLLQIFS